MILGRTVAGTLALSEDGKGLAFDVELPATSAARDLLVSVERGDVAGASFAFTVPKGGDRWTFAKDGPAKRELLDVNLLDVTVAGSRFRKCSGTPRMRTAGNLPLPLFTSSKVERSVANPNEFANFGGVND